MDPDRINEYTIRDLINKLNYYTKKYDEGNPEIGDKEWDDMYFDLQELESWTGLYFEDSPTQKVIFQEVSKLNKVEHNHPMLSLDKTKSVDAVKSFLGNKDFICMAKMDGLTCSLRYLDGKLVSAETRGNGQIGEDILHNALVVKNIPKRINYQNELIIDGEIICTYKDFEPFAAEYKNPRNFASGSIRLLDSSECAKRNLTFVAWDIVKGFDEEKENSKLLTGYYNEKLSDKLLEADALGFTIVPFEVNLSEYKNIEQIMEVVKKSSSMFPIDGLVFKYNNCDEYIAAGKTDHHFKGGLAYKFYDEEYETTLLDLEWTMGRTGVLTPVAILNPIDIEGTEVSRASLHNISIMEELLKYAPFKGQKVYVYKANMIIPQISRSEELFMDTIVDKFEYIHIPEICPVCGGATKIVQENESKILMCDNPQCEGKLVNRIEHFFGKKGLDAKGISKATIEKLISWGWVESITDVFELSKHAKEWKNIQGFGEKSVTNILESIERSKSCVLESIISAAGIPLIGRTVARDLAKRFNTYGDFRDAIRNGFDFTKFDGYGYEMHKAISTFNYTELDNIVENYLTIEKNNDIINVEKLKDLTFCITGKVHIWKNRDELSAEIEKLGGKVTGSVSKNTNYLINNDVNSTSAKNNKAKELGIQIISEEDFKKIFDI